MSTDLVQNHHALFVPPVELPMRFRRPRGLFGIDRRRDEVTVATSSGPFTYRPLQYHEGLDLYADQGKPVFAARRGEVVTVAGSGGNRMITIRHIQPGGRAFVTRYLHLQDPLVAGPTSSGPGDDVEPGQCIGFVGDVEPPHLHFEIMLIVNNGVPNDWHRINSEHVDPLPFMYPWEKIYFEQPSASDDDVEVPQLQAAAPLQAVDVVRGQSIPMFRVRQNGKWYRIPLYYLDSGDRQLVSLLQDAYMGGKSVRLASRKSPFFEDISIITKARVVG